MPLRLCTFGGCKTVAEVSSTSKTPARCPLHPLTYSTTKRHYEHHHHNGKNIYKSQQWVHLRNAYAAHQPLCEHCLQYDIITPGFVVDHIVEILDGGQPFEWSNLQHLCNTCHNAKTAREKVKRRKKKDNNGFGNISDF